MTTPNDIIKYIENLAGEKLHFEEGIHFGSADVEVKKVVLCWMTTKGAIEFAGKEQAELIITHESLYYPYDAIVRDDNPPNWENWPVNKQRRNLLSKYNLTVLRIHTLADMICVFDAFRKQLNLPDQPARQGNAYNHKRFDITPCKLSELINYVKQSVGIDHIRVSAPNGLDQIVSKVGLLWGGIGLFVNVIHQAKLLELGCDVFIAGESDDYGFRFARDLGIPLIETSHEISENEGIKEFCNILSKGFPKVEFKFYENKCPYIWA